MRGVRIPLSTVELLQACRSHERVNRVHFGVFSIDLLPTCSAYKKPFHLIVNCSPSTQPGSHWLSLYCSKDGTVEILDSLARGPPFDARLVHFAKKFGSVIRTNSHVLQDDASVACGLFALSHAHFRTAGMAFEAWLARFEKHDLKRNSRIVECDFIRHYAMRNAQAPTLPKQTFGKWVALCRADRARPESANHSPLS